MANKIYYYKVVQQRVLGVVGSLKSIFYFMANLLLSVPVKKVLQ